MSELVWIIVGIAAVGYVLAGQLRGEALRGKRVIVLPAVLTVVGALSLHSGHTPVHAADVVCLAAGAGIAMAIGVVQGCVMRLENRNGALWGQLPPAGLWLWAALIASRLTLLVVAHGLDARIAASSATILLTLGINRLTQGGVVALRAVAAGIPFAPEKDGTTFLARPGSGSGLGSGSVFGSGDRRAMRAARRAH